MHQSIRHVRRDAPLAAIIPFQYRMLRLNTLRKKLRKERKNYFHLQRIFMGHHVLFYMMAVAPYTKQDHLYVDDMSYLQAQINGANQH